AFCRKEGWSNHYPGRILPVSAPGAFRLCVCRNMCTSSADTSCPKGPTNWLWSRLLSWVVNSRVEGACMEELRFRLEVYDRICRTAASMSEPAGCWKVSNPKYGMAASK